MDDKEEEFELYAEAFHAAAQHLLARLMDAPAYSSHEAYPILFMYRHALELYLKGVILAGAKLMKVRRTLNLSTGYVFKSHNLSRLLDDVRLIFDDVGSGWDIGAAGLHSFADVKALVSEIERLDKQSDAFRYPVDSHGNPIFTVGSDLNVATLSKRLDPLLEALDGTVTLLDQEFQHACERTTDDQ